MTYERYAELVAIQAGRCAICAELVGMLVIDHDHRCCLGSQKRCGSCNRDLLCHMCNMGLGHFRDDSVRLAAAIRYLRKWGK